MSPRTVRGDPRRSFVTAITDLAHTIILADDDDDEFRVTFAEALRLQGARVIEASGGEMTTAILDRLTRSRDVEQVLEVLQKVRKSRRCAQLSFLIVTAVNDPRLTVGLNVPVVIKADIDTMLNAARGFGAAMVPSGG
jgi:response regulator RpfG family c-di-GMP phosphodiesterase